MRTLFHGKKEFWVNGKIMINHRLDMPADQINGLKGMIKEIDSEFPWIIMNENNYPERSIDKLEMSILNGRVDFEIEPESSLMGLRQIKAYDNYLKKLGYELEKRNPWIRLVLITVAAEKTSRAST